MAYIGRLEHQGGAKVTTLTHDFPAGALTFDIADPEGWPDGSVGPFYVSADKGELNEEKILCSSRSGVTVVVWSDPVAGNGRGVDGTVDVRHGTNAKIEHVWTATEADQANAHIHSADGAHGYPPKDTIVTTDGDQVILGEKTLMAPILEGGEVHGAAVTGGTIIDATKISVTGAQAEAEFRVRNVYIGTGVPSNGMGSDGDLYIMKDV
jgi:hypothetical protein